MLTPNDVRDAAFTTKTGVTRDWYAAQEVDALLQEAEDTIRALTNRKLIKQAITALAEKDTK